MSDKTIPRSIRRDLKRLSKNSRPKPLELVSSCKRKRSTANNKRLRSFVMAEQSSNSGLVISAGRSNSSSTSIPNSHDCVDLTNDSLIDLTEQQQSSPLSIRLSSHSQSTHSSSQRPSCRYSNVTTSSSPVVPFSPPGTGSQQEVVFLHSTKTDNDVIIVNSSPAPPTSSHRERKKRKLPSPPPSPPVEVTSISSPADKASSLSCPICLETVTQFRTRGSKLVTTICGHVFCSSCIRNAISTMHKCPSCRKNLTLKQYHQLFL